MKIQALKLKPAKQHMEAGKIYKVSEDLGNLLIDSGKAIKAKPEHKIGEVYDLPKKKKKKADDLLG